MNTEIDTKAAEKKLNEFEETMKESKLVKKLPTEIKHLTLDDILQFALIQKMAYFFPCYIIVEAGSSHDSNANFLTNILNFLHRQLGWIILIDLLFQGAIYYLSLVDFLKLTWVSLFLKDGILGALIIFKVMKKGETIYSIANLAFLFFAIAIDVGFIFYLNMYFQSLKTNDDEKV